MKNVDFDFLQNKTTFYDVCFLLKKFSEKYELLLSGILPLFIWRYKK